MIVELLNREFLLSAAEDTRLMLRQVLSDRERRSGPPEGPLEEIDSSHLQEVVEALAAVAEQAEGLPASAQPAQPGGPAPKEDFLYMPRDPLLSIIQSEIEAAAERQRPEAIAEGTPQDDPGSDDDAPIVSDRRFASLELPRSEDNRRAWGHFEVARPKILSDPRWVWSGVVIAWHEFKQPVAFGGLPDGAIPIADNARILLVGDWGSGLDRAQAVAQRMRAELDKGVAEGREQHVVHLGDVYYTGSKREYETNFLPCWPVRDGEAIASYNLVGNHDMYRGGGAFYDTCLGDQRFASQGGHSVFALRNENWQLLGLDTAYEDGGLHGDQATWVRSQLDANPDLRTALLSHHQLFAPYDERDGKNTSPALREKIRPVLATDRIDAWFWAHEHRCLVYGPHERVRFSSCVGHGGIPEYLVAHEGDPYLPPMRYDYRLKRGSGLEPWNTFGFAVLDVDGRAMHVRYIDEDGVDHHTEELAPG